MWIKVAARQGGQKRGQISFAASVRRKEAMMVETPLTPATRNSLAQLLAQMQALAAVIPSLSAQPFPALAPVTARDFETKFDNIPV
jgi:hypothetical protein